MRASLDGSLKVSAVWARASFGAHGLGARSTARQLGAFLSAGNQQARIAFGPAFDFAGFVAAEEEKGDIVDYQSSSLSTEVAGLRGRPHGGKLASGPDAQTPQ